MVFASFALLATLFTTTRADQQLVNLTVYNSELALVHDRRSVVLTAGQNQIAWRDVSASMDPVSAILDAVDSSLQLHVLEQNFDYDVLGQTSLLRAYVGKYVTVVHPPRFAGERERRERAKILSIDDGIVLQYPNRIETTVDGSIEYPGIPSNLLDQPTLTMDVDSAVSGKESLDLQYLTRGLSWHADYIGTLNASQTRMNLIGLVTLDNESGITYRNARLQLVAGNVNAPPPSPRALSTIAHVTSDVYSVNGNVSQESYLEYHLYTMARPTTILNKQTKQLTLLAARDVPIEKTLELRGNAYYYQGAHSDLGARIPVGVYLSFVNRGGELGIPLPGGTVRVYLNDTQGLSQFAGSDSIPHTPRGDTVRLHLGDSFDVVANKRQTDFKLFDSGCDAISSYEITLLNGKEQPQDVSVVEPIPGDWKITATNMPYHKTSAMTATWLVHAAKDGKTVLTYSAEVRWCGE